VFLQALRSPFRAFCAYIAVVPVRPCRTQFNFKPELSKFRRLGPLNE
jgi:hypothetical protein